MTEVGPKVSEKRAVKLGAESLRVLRAEHNENHEYMQALEALKKQMKKKQKKTALQTTLYGLLKHVWKQEIQTYKQSKQTLKKAEKEYRFLQDVDIDAVKSKFIVRPIDIDTAKEKGGGKVLLLKRLVAAKQETPDLTPKRFIKNEASRILANMPAPYTELETSQQRYVRKQFHYLEELKTYIVC